MFPEGADEDRAPTHATQHVSGVDAGLAEVLGAEIGQLVMLPVAPNALDRVQLRGVGGESLEEESPLLGGDQVAHQVAAVGLVAVAVPVRARAVPP